MALKSKKLKKLVYLLTLLFILRFNDDTLNMLCALFIGGSTFWLATVMEKPRSSFQLTLLIAITLALTNNFTLLLFTITQNCFFNAQIMVEKEKWAFLRFGKRFGLTAIASVLSWQNTMKTGDELRRELSGLMLFLVVTLVLWVISLGTLYLFSVWMGLKHSPDVKLHPI